MNIRTVSEVNNYIKLLISSELPLQNLAITGEISNYKQYPSGHCYFTLKDASSSIKCVMFRSVAKFLTFSPNNGMKVIAFGNIDIYIRDGIYQLYVTKLSPDGVGERTISLEQLKIKLKSKGYFDEAKKKPLPFYPKKIGVVTSIAGAVIKDIYNVSKSRNPSITLILYPVKVQGEDAAKNIATAINYFNTHKLVDLLIVGRGGGSIEDLWAFNEEILADAIFSSQIPIISAVGHETDFTLSDLVADVRAATPSHAAEIAVPDIKNILRHIESLNIRLFKAKEKILVDMHNHVMLLHNNLISKTPSHIIAKKKEYIRFLCEKITNISSLKIKLHKQQTLFLLKRLDILNPVNLLKNGYSILTKNNEIFNSVNNINLDDTVKVTLFDGDIVAIVKAIDRKE